jgi:hypothetical protein
LHHQQPRISPASNLDKRILRLRLPTTQQRDHINELPRNGRSRLRRPNTRRHPTLIQLRSQRKRRLRQNSPLSIEFEPLDKTLYRHRHVPVFHKTGIKVGNRRSRPTMHKPADMLRGDPKLSRDL